MIKKHFSKYLIVASLMTSTFLSVNTSLAGVASGSFQVTAAVAASCTVSASSLAFGNFTLSTINATSTITVTCTNSTPYSVGIDGGTNGTITARRMAGSGAAAGSFLNYGLYTDIARSTNWGNTLATNWVTGTGTGSAQTLTVYGQLPGSGNQTAPVGSYTDTVNVTITF